MTIISSWPNAIAHVDCDAFYASCEAVRRPDLQGRPLCVLSSLDAIVVAKSYDAKALGITTGMPVWEARKLAPKAEFLAADFRYYGQMSEKVFSILRRYSPVVEIYSIDEAFIDMNGIRGLWHKSFAQIADDIREVIQRETGITASVGISVTRTLAKMASESNKPDGTTIVSGKRIAHFLESLPVAAIPGLGRNRVALLQKFGVHSVPAILQIDDGMLARLLGRQGMVLKQELCGRSVVGVQHEPAPPKSMAKTSAMGVVTTSRDIISAHLAWHTMRLVSDLVAKHLLAEQIHMFLTLASFERVGTRIRLEVPGNSLQRIMAAVKSGLASLFRQGERYRGCGVIAMPVRADTNITPELFGFGREDSRQIELMLTMNTINRRFGERTISLASVSQIRPRKARPRFHYPLITAC